VRYPSCNACSRRTRLQTGVTVDVRQLSLCHRGAQLRCEISG
jgi:hypothetical protein